MLPQLSEQEVKAILEGASAESRQLEFKQGLNWSDTTEEALRLKESIIRAVLGFTNTLGGGTIVIGIKEKDGTLRIDGIEAAKLTSFNNQDHIRASIDTFATIPLQYLISGGEFDDQGTVKKFVFIQVSEFSEIPAICRKNGKTDELKKGEIYGRSLTGPVSTKVITDLELREVCRMYADKESGGLAQRLGIDKLPTNPTVPTPLENYRAENQDWEAN